MVNIKAWNTPNRNTNMYRLGGCSQTYIKERLKDYWRDEFVLKVKLPAECKSLTCDLLYLIASPFLLYS